MSDGRREDDELEENLRRHGSNILEGSSDQLDEAIEYVGLRPRSNYQGQSPSVLSIYDWTRVSKIGIDFV